MKYAVLVYETKSDYESRTDPDRMGAYWGAYSAYAQALKEGGAAAGGNALQPPTTATTIRVRAGKQQVQDGPYADTKEQLGGMFVIEAASLDEAMTWAARCPAALTGCVEVRPVLSM